MDRDRPEEIELRSAQRRWANINPKECWVGVDPNIFFFSFFFGLGETCPTILVWDDTGDIKKRKRKKKKKEREKPVAHDVASGDEKEEWRW
jgi:hypothetical protein